MKNSQNIDFQINIKDESLTIADTVDDEYYDL